MRKFIHLKIVHTFYKTSTIRDAEVEFDFSWFVGMVMNGHGQIYLGKGWIVITINNKRKIRTKLL